MKPKVSVIVPVYNVEYYLSKCLTSIIKQTYSNLEIIIIDDGSDDRSAEICDEFSKKDKRVIVVHKKNEGVSIARNLGIKMATGEYLMFVDSDDYIPENSIEILLESIRKYKVQLCCGAWKKIFAKRNVKNSYDDLFVDCRNEKQLEKYLEIEEVNGPVAKLYITKIIQRNRLEFLPGIKIGEDAIFNYQYIQHCEKVLLIGKIVYIYNKLNNVSATHTYYEYFGKCAYLTAIEEKKCLQRQNEELTEESVRAICKRFVSAIRYIQYYGMDEKEKIEKIKETYQIFAPELSQCERKMNNGIAKRYFELCKKNQYKDIIDELDENKKNQIGIKTYILNVMAEIKKRWIYRKR